MSYYKVIRPYSNEISTGTILELDSESVNYVTLHLLCNESARQHTSFLDKRIVENSDYFFEKLSENHINAIVVEDTVKYVAKRLQSGHSEVDIIHSIIDKLNSFDSNDITKNPAYQTLGVSMPKFDSQDVVSTDWVLKNILGIDPDKDLTEIKTLENNATNVEKDLSKKINEKMDEINKDITRQKIREDRQKAREEDNQKSSIDIVNDLAHEMVERQSTKFKNMKKKVAEDTQNSTEKRPDPERDIFTILARFSNDVELNHKITSLISQKLTKNKVNFDPTSILSLTKSDFSDLEVIFNDLLQKHLDKLEKNKRSAPISLPATPWQYPNTNPFNPTFTPLNQQPCSVCGQKFGEPCWSVACPNAIKITC